MRTPQYTASKSRTQGRKAWTLTFRHPVCRDDEGRPGIKVRRGLGTSDESAADAMVEEMNILLRDETYWNIAERERAQQHFSTTVVRAFYEPMKSPVAVDSTADSRWCDSSPGQGRRLFPGAAHRNHWDGQDFATASSDRNGSKA